MVSGASDLPSGVKIVSAVLTPFARTMRTLTVVPSDVVVVSSAPFVKKVCFEMIIK